MSEPDRDNQEPEAKAAKRGLIRLGCAYCDRTDFDGIETLPTDWTRIQAVRADSELSWETNLGVCPDCRWMDDDSALGAERPPPSDDSDDGNAKAAPVHPIIKQIIDRDCHVATPSKDVVKHVISKLRHGYKTYREMPKADRAKLVEQCVVHHRRNFKEYVEVMSGFTRTVGKEPGSKSKLSGMEIVALMRKHKVTTEQLSFRMGITQKRIRLIRRVGLTNPLFVRDWLQAITGEDPGPIPKPYLICNQTESTDCGFCGCPLMAGDQAFEYVGEVFCSTTCCRKSRGW